MSCKEEFPKKELFKGGRGMTSSPKKALPKGGQVMTSSQGRHSLYENME